MFNAWWLLEVALRLAGLPGMAAQQEEDPPPRYVIEPPAARASSPAFAGELRLTFSSANPEHLHRRDLASWQQAGGELVHAAIGYDPRDPLWAKALRLGAAGAAHYVVEFAVHEFGHVSSFSRAGLRSVSWGSEHMAEEEWRTPDVQDFFTGAFEDAPASISVSPSDWEEIGRIFEGRPREFAEFMVLTKAGGLNQEQAALAEYAERLDEDALSVLHVVPYQLAALSTVGYDEGSGDLRDYLDRLEELGVSADLSAVRRLSMLRLLSGSALALTGALLEDLLGRGDGRAEPIRFDLGDGVRASWPEIESYLSRYGPTLKTSVGLRFGALRLLPSYERSFAGGESTHELGLKARGELGLGLRFLAAAFRGDEGGTWAEGGLEARPFSWLRLEASYTLASGYTVHREIYGTNLPMIDARESGIRLSVGVSLAF